MGLFNRNNRSASEIAQERLKLVLIQDRLSLSSKEFEMLKEDIINVLSKYFGIDTNDIRINLERVNDKNVFEAVVPVISHKKEK
jgi:cell division topological specificity factor